MPLSDEQTKWLLSKFDCNRDGKVDYQEFTKMLTGWRNSEGGKSDTKSTGLQWKFGQMGSPYKQGDEAREAVSLLEMGAVPVLPGVRFY